MEIDEAAVEAVAQAIHDHWQGAPSRAARSWQDTCEKLPGQADDFRRKARAAILAYESSRSQSARDAVIEECAKIAETLPNIERTHNGFTAVRIPNGRDCADAIRALKRPADRKGGQ